MTQNDELDNRLKACASFVRYGKICADIGSDHAYLPIYLAKSGICRFAVASDINDGPVKRAETNVRLSALSDKVAVIKSDGLNGAENYLPDDIVIAGMGGELIRDILKASEYVKRPDIRLILQPMTLPEILREYLLFSGFCITDEKICTAAGKYYQVICCHYDGIRRSVDRFCLLIGEKNLERMKASPTDDDKHFLAVCIETAKRRTDGRLMSKNPDTDAIRLDSELIKLCENLLEK